MTETLRAGTLKTKESMDKQNLAVDEWWNTTCFSKCVKHKWDILGRWNPMQKPLTALEMLWREHVYWFYYCNQQQKNASRMLAHCRGPSTDAIPASLLLFITLTQHFLLFPPKNSIQFDDPCIFSEVALSSSFILKETTCASLQRIFFHPYFPFSGWLEPWNMGTLQLTLRPHWWEASQCGSKDYWTQTSLVLSLELSGCTVWILQCFCELPLE